MSAGAISYFAVKLTDIGMGFDKTLGMEHVNTGNFVSSGSHYNEGNTMENWQKRKIDRSLKYQTRVFSEHINELVAVKREGKVITLDDGRKMVEFVSCSYLGLETHPALKQAVVDAIERFGVQVSVARTRVKVDLFPQLEARLNDIMHRAHTLTFNAVTPCHIAVLPLLASGTLPHFTFSKKTVLYYGEDRARDVADQPRPLTAIWRSRQN
ncbi:hypothetical protein LNO81_30950 [Klebsiella variicola subsp. variicola]|nr:hypothetical protein [Klebsiella variicola subsp. variicola]